MVGIGGAAMGARSLDKTVHLGAAIGGNADQHLRRFVRVRNSPLGKAGKFFMGQQHGVDGV